MHIQYGTPIKYTIVPLSLVKLCYSAMFSIGLRLFFYGFLIHVFIYFCKSFLMHLRSCITFMSTELFSPLYPTAVHFIT